MKRVVISSAILAITAAFAAGLLLPGRASTQTLPPPSIMRGVVETSYVPAGVSTIGSAGSIAWFVETNANKERYPIACVSTSGKVECKRGSFP